MIFIIIININTIVIITNTINIKYLFLKLLFPVIILLFGY